MIIRKDNSSSKSLGYRYNRHHICNQNFGAIKNLECDAFKLALTQALESLPKEKRLPYGEGLMKLIQRQKNKTPDIVLKGKTILTAKAEIDDAVLEFEMPIWKAPAERLTELFEKTIKSIEDFVKPTSYFDDLERYLKDYKNNGCILVYDKDFVKLLKRLINDLKPEQRKKYVDDLKKATSVQEINIENYLVKPKVTWQSALDRLDIYNRGNGFCTLKPVNPVYNNFSYRNFDKETLYYNMLGDDNGAGRMLDVLTAFRNGIVKTVKDERVQNAIEIKNQVTNFLKDVQ